MTTRASSTAEDSAYVLEPLREGADFTLYRGRARGNQMPILAVAVARERPTAQSVRRLEHEYSLATELDAAWAAQPLALTRHQGRTALILKDPGGEPLDQVIEQHKGQPIDLTRFLHIAIGMAVALSEAHRQGLIHKDVKPANTLIDHAGHAWLTGFGIASQLPRERQAPAPPEMITGTLAYMSPEQTGRMNRSMDARSDLYSLGVTLYQMLTGVLPFAATDPLEWVHCHIARQPAAPAGHWPVPEPLSAIVMRLLAKNAEERYQTATGLEADLRSCLSQWQSRRRIDPFPLGKEDSSDRLLIPEKLYGRKREVDTLLSAFDRVVAQGSTEVVLVSGYSGVGKSSVVNELHKVLVPPRGLFAAGKFDQYKRDVPYATLAQAFQMLVREILVKSETEVELWRHALLQALGPNGQLIVNLIPEVQFVIGKQPAVPELPPQEARARFQLVFRRFLGAFARPEHPLALFLDDLQWLDAATLEVLERLVTDPEVRHVLLIGAYRDNEVSASHSLMQTLAAIRDAGARVQEIVLAPLGLDDVKQFVAEALHREREYADPLALSIYEKTGGNPFFVIQFLTSLAEEGLLRFDRKAADWIWNLRRIRAKGYSGNVVEFMVAKLRRLSGRTQAALQQVACVGNSAETATLSVVFGQSEEEIHAALLKAVRTGLILRMERSYAFLHDRVQEAAYALIPDSQRAEIHLRVGRLLLAHTPPEERAEAIFEIVNQLNRGAGLITSEDERFQLAELNLVAGKRAKASTAHASALQYFIAGGAFLTDDDWDRRHDLIFQLELHRAECEFLTGDSASAERRLSTLSQRARGDTDRSEATCLQIEVCTATNHSDRAVEICLEYLRRVGVEWTHHPTKEQFRQEYDQFLKNLAGRPVEALINLPRLADPIQRATLNVLSAVGPSAFFTDENLLNLSFCRTSNISVLYGNDERSPLAYTYLGSILRPKLGDHEMGYRLGKLGMDLVAQGLDRWKCRVYVCFGTLINPWSRHVRTSLDWIRQAFESALEVGDFTYAGYCCQNLIPLLIANGNPLAEVHSEALKRMEFAKKIKFGLVIDCLTGQIALIRQLRGLTRDFSSFDDGEFDENAFERHLEGDPLLAFSACWYWIRKLQARFYAGDHSAALAAAARAAPLLWTSPSFFEMAEYHFFNALSHAALCPCGEEGERQRHLQAIAAHQEQLAAWAANCPENFENRAILVAAEMARIEDHPIDAEQLYEKAIHSARVNGFPNSEALANELAARFYRARGLEKVAKAYLQDARRFYTRWGAEGKVRQLDELYPRGNEEHASTPSATLVPLGGQLDIETVVKASQALSSEMVLSGLIEKLVRLALEHAGAERGLLILIHGGEPRIEAEAVTRQREVEVVVRQELVSPSDLPRSALHYLIRTHEAVLLDDASVDRVYSQDDYVRRKRSQSVLCLPILRQKKLVGALYLENGLTPCAFTPDRVTVLQLLASQAAISLENASLYSDLQREGQNFRHIVDTIPGFLCTMTAQGRVEFLNQGILDYTGWAAERFADWRPLLHPDERELVTARWVRSVETGDPYEIEHRILGADGVYRWFLVRGLAVRDTEGRIVRWYVLVTDIDERKKTHERLQRSEAFLAQGQGISQTGSFGWSVASGEFYWSKQIYNILEYDPADCATLDLVFQRVHPDDRDAVRGILDDAIREKKDFASEHRLLMPDGRIKYVHVTARAVHTGNLDFVGAVRDITERTRAEEALRQAQDDLARINRVTTMGELTASLAHELNQPISGALLNANVCLRNVASDEPELSELRTAITRMARDTQRAADIIDRMRSQFKRGDRSREMIDINEITQQTVALLRDEAIRYSISVRTELAADLPRILGDRVQLQQVAMNLILNGFEAMEQIAGIREMMITSRGAEGEILVSVSDTGIGFPPRLEKRIFDPFFTTKPQGTGMGLRICRSIIESHSGRLWAVSTPGAGATFHFSLPAATAHPN